MTIDKCILAYILLSIGIAPLSHASSSENINQIEISNSSDVGCNSLVDSCTNVSSHDNSIHRTSTKDSFAEHLHFEGIHQTIHSIPKWLLDHIQVKPFPDHLLSDSALTNYSELIGSIRRNYAQWLNYERGFAIVVLSFCLSTSIFGCVYFFRIFCCHARKRRRAPEKCANSDGQPKAFTRFCSNFALFLLVVLICSLIACAFMYNHRAHNSITTAGSIAEKSVDDLDIYKRNTLKEMKVALMDNFSKLKQSINHQLDDSAEDFLSFTFSTLKSTLFHDLSNFTSELELLNNMMKKMILNLNESGVEIEQLESNITVVESWLLDQLNACLNNTGTEEESECKKALTLVRQYADSTRNSASDFVKEIRKQGRFLRTLLWSIDAATISRNISENLDEFRSNIRSELAKERKKIDQNILVIEDSLNRTWARLLFGSKVDLSGTKVQISQYQKTASEFESFRWILSLISCSFIAFIVVCLLIGCIFSTCGSKPHFLRNSYFSWSRSTCFFLSATILTTISIMLLSLAISVIFIFGGNGWTVLCQNTETFDPELSPVFKIFDRYWKIHRHRFAGLKANRDHLDYGFLADYDLETILQGCRENKTFFSIFDLSRRLKFNETFELNQQVEKASKLYREKLQNIEVDLNIIESFQRISNYYLSMTRNSLQSSYFSQSHLDDLHKVLESFHFEEKLFLLQQTANKFQSSNLNNIFNNAIAKLQIIHDENVGSLRRLNGDFLNHFNFTAQQILPAVIRPLENIVESGKSKILENVTKDISSYAADLAEQLYKQLSSSSSEYIANLRNKLETQITSCNPVRDIVTDSVNAACESVIDPINSLWASAGMALILLMPAVGLAYNMRSLYINVLRCDMDSRGSEDSRRCIVDAYSTVTDDYGCYRRDSDSSYHGEISRNFNVQHLKYPTDRDNFAMESRLPPPYSRP